MKVSDAAAGATRLTSPQESANSRLKNATAIAATPRKKFGFDRTRADDRPESRAAHECVHVPDLLHGARQENVADDGEEDHHKNAAPGVKVLHRFRSGGRGTRPTTAVRVSTAAVPTSVAVMRGERRASGNESDAPGNQDDAHPAQRAHLFVQDEAGDQREQHVSQRSCGQNVGQVRPGKRVHVEDEEGQKQNNAERDPGIEHGQNHAWTDDEGKCCRPASSRAKAWSHPPLQRRLLQPAPDTYERSIELEVTQLDGCPSSSRFLELETGCTFERRELRLDWLRRRGRRQHAASPSCCAPRAASKSSSPLCTGACGRCCQIPPSAGCGRPPWGGNNIRRRSDAPPT